MGGNTYDTYKLSFQKNGILNICVFVNEDSMMLKGYTHFHFHLSWIFGIAFAAFTFTDTLPGVLPPLQVQHSTEKENADNDSAYKHPSSSGTHITVLNVEDLASFILIQLTHKNTIFFVSSGLTETKKPEVDSHPQQNNKNIH